MFVTRIPNTVISRQLIADSGKAVRQEISKESASLVSLLISFESV